MILNMCKGFEYFLVLFNNLVLLIFSEFIIDVIQEDFMIGFMIINL